MLIFRQLYDQQSSTYTYLLGDSDSGEAIRIERPLRSAKAPALASRSPDVSRSVSMGTARLPSAGAKRGWHASVVARWKGASRIE